MSLLASRPSIIRFFERIGGSLGSRARGDSYLGMRRVARWLWRNPDGSIVSRPPGLEDFHEADPNAGEPVTADQIQECIDHFHGGYGRNDPHLAKLLSSIHDFEDHSGTNQRKIGGSARFRIIGDPEGIRPICEAIAQLSTRFAYTVGWWTHSAGGYEWKWKSTPVYNPLDYRGDRAIPSTDAAPRTIRHEGHTYTREDDSPYSEAIQNLHDVVEDTHDSPIGEDQGSNYTAPAMEIMLWGYPGDWDTNDGEEAW